MIKIMFSLALVLFLNGCATINQDKMVRFKMLSTQGTVEQFLMQGKHLKQGNQDKRVTGEYINMGNKVQFVSHW